MKLISLIRILPVLAGWMVAIAIGPASVDAQGLPGRYHRYLEMRNALATLRAANPEIIRLDTVGYSTRLGIPILALKISGDPGIDLERPAAFICGGAHANEVLGPEVVLGFAEDFSGRYSQGDTMVTNLVNSLEIFIIPMINPEGHVAVEMGNLDWRKNQCDNDSNGVFNFHDGVDNNRNYDLGWALANDAKAITPESSMYRGTAPFTQSENVALSDLGWHYRPVVALDYHSPAYGLGEVAYYPWYWRTTDGGHGAAPDEVLMNSIARSFAALIVNDAGDSTYQARRAVVGEGDFNTFFYGTFGTAVFTVEVSDTTIQNADMVDGIVSRNLPAIYYLLRRALGGRITGVVRDSVTLEPLEAEVAVVERNNADLRPRLSRPDNGRYNRIMGPGTFTLRFTKTGYFTRQISGVVIGNSPVTNNVFLAPIDPRPPAPILLYPSDGQRLGQGQITFDWSDVNLATRYMIEIAADSNFTTIIRRDSSLAQSQYRPASPLADGHYFWRVKGGNANGWGPFAAAYDFFVDPQSVIDNEMGEPGDFHLGPVYPNPFNARAIIRYSLTSSAHVRILIHDILGREIACLADADQEAGAHQAIWDAVDHPSGLYFYSIEAGGRIHRGKVVLLR